MCLAMSESLEINLLLQLLPLPRSKASKRHRRVPARSAIDRPRQLANFSLRFDTLGDLARAQKRRRSEQKLLARD
jgi:hypothetical protein